MGQPRRKPTPDEPETFGKLGAEGEMDETELTPAEKAAREAAEQRAADAAEFDKQEENRELPPLSGIDLEADTLRGDIAELFMNGIVRAMPDKFHKCNKFEQDRIITRVNELSRAIIRKTFMVLADRGLPKIRGMTGKWSVDGEKGIELKFKALGNHDNITALADHGRGVGILVLADIEAYDGARVELKAEEDQPELPIDGDAPHDPDTGEVQREPVAA